MTSKQKVILTKQSKHQFQHLLRHYQSALQLTKSGQYLLPPDLFKILDTMGYLCQEKTQKDYELANSLVFLLSIPRGKGTVSQRNLFQFLVTLNNLKGNVDSHFQSEVQPLPKDLPQLEEPLVKIQIGNFDEKGVWLLSKQQEKKVRDIFSNMIYTRVSRQEIKTIKKKDKIESENKQDLFHPFILDKSVRMADHRQKALQLSIRVEDRLLESNDLYHSRLQSSLKKSLQKQIKECSFRPRINSSSNKFGKQNRRQSSEQILLMKGRQYQLRRKIHQQEYNQLKTQAQLSQCKFKPDLSSSSVSLRYSLKRQTNPNIRNGQKAIQRMRVARQQRESLNEFHQRGYPKDQSWRQFMDDLKMKRQKTIAHNTSASIDQSQAIFKIELKLLGQFKIIEVRQGDDILILAHKICKDNRISEDNIEKVFNTIERILRQSGQVMIKNRRVFPFKKL